MPEYGAVPTQDPEQGQQQSTSQQASSCFVKLKDRILHPRHRKAAIAAWLVVLGIAVTLVISIHYSLLPINANPHDDVLATCRSDRSAFIALMLSIFLGPLGIDRLYLGYVFVGLIKFVTGGLFGILWVASLQLLISHLLPWATFLTLADAGSINGLLLVG
ncbi:hypothetical protein INT43_001860 [Umbelopsis isabellina]|uniref:TM2 domain-containing protein n=1 Tax=Mortierella isabellina TaxID=91625 RepID=A0A8H7PTL3_MORIS|nr:hypothetical protein INT43_001860 [Umbelopsis isabellina]